MLIHTLMSDLYFLLRCPYTLLLAFFSDTFSNYSLE